MTNRLFTSKTLFNLQNSGEIRLNVEKQSYNITKASAICGIQGDLVQLSGMQLEEVLGCPGSRIQSIYSLPFPLTDPAHVEKGTISCCAHALKFRRQFSSCLFQNHIILD